MRKTFALTAAGALALVLAACGSSPDEVAEEINDAAETPAAEIAVDPEAGAVVEADDADESEDGTAAATPSPTPSASGSAARTATPTPAPRAAATQPAAFATCAVCHSTQPGQNGIGPSLAGVVGRRAGTLPGANYSAAMQAANLTWNDANLQRYLADPTAVVPGTTMPPPGLDAAQRRAVIEYLKTL